MVNLIKNPIITKYYEYFRIRTLISLLGLKLYTSKASVNPLSNRINLHNCFEPLSIFVDLVGLVLINNLHFTAWNGP